MTSACIASVLARFRKAQCWLHQSRLVHSHLHADHEPRLDLYGLQARAMRPIVESGECFVRFPMVQPSPAKPIGLRLQVLECDHPDTAPAGWSALKIEPTNNECWFHGRQSDATAARSNSHVRHQQMPEARPRRFASGTIRGRRGRQEGGPPFPRSASARRRASRQLASLRASSAKGRKAG